MQIYQKTGDEHFSLIIVDYESEDMDIEQEVKKSSFKKYCTHCMLVSLHPQSSIYIFFPRIHVLNMKGDFSRSAGLQAGIDYVKVRIEIVLYNNETVAIYSDNYKEEGLLEVGYLRLVAADS